MLRDCFRAKQIWTSIGFGNTSRFFSMDGGTWYKTQLQQHHGVLFACTCWFIWKSRNVELFEDTAWSLWFTLIQIQSTYQILISNHYLAPTKDSSLGGLLSFRGCSLHSSPASATFCFSRRSGCSLHPFLVFFFFFPLDGLFLIFFVDKEKKVRYIYLT